MRAILLLLIWFILLPSAAGINVVVSIADFGAIAKEIGGNDVNVSVILPPGADPHSFSVTKEVVDEIKEADLIILANSALLSYERNIKESYDKEYLDFDDYEGVELFDFDGIEKNPHGYWLYANNSISIARAIAEKLAEIEPEKAEYFNASLKNFEERMKEAWRMANDVAEQKNLKGKKFVAAVPGVCYIGRNVGMEADKIMFAEGTSLLNAREMEEIKEKLRKGEYVAIVVPEFLKNAKAGEVARQLAMETNASIVYVKFAEGGGSYTSLFYYNAVQMLSAGGEKVVEKHNLLAIYLSITLALLVAVETFLLYKCWRIE